MSDILLIGKPNAGKSLLFNKLTGLKHKVANFPGVTVEVKSGKFGSNNIVDYPGVYSLNPLSLDEEVAVNNFLNAFKNNEVETVVCVLDATRLERSLVLALQVKKLAAEYKKALILAINMIDEIEKHKATVKVKELSEHLGVKVIALSAKTGKGVDQLKSLLELSSEQKNEFIPSKIIDGDIPKLAKELNEKFGHRSPLILSKQNNLDRFFLSNIGGGIIFLLIMLFLFQAIFSWAEPLMDLIESSITVLGVWFANFFPNGFIKDFILDAVFGGLGSFLVFVPQIAILTFIIGILEDSGYLARAAIICHKPFSFFGLSGKSFVPFLSGYACAIPAIMSARMIESPRKRLLTILTIPLIPCSARLPVYALFIAILIPEKTFLGIISYKALTFFLLYFFGLFMALLLSALLEKWTKKKKGDDLPFIIELPPYRLPNFSTLLRKATRSAYLFVVKAGPLIFTVTTVIWFLGYFPNFGADLNSSWLSNIGKFIEPIFKPLGLDWRYGVAIIVSFLAREVFVGTLGTLFGIEGADENITGLADQVRADGISAATGFSLLVFYAIALQCVSTVAVIKQETGSKLMAWGSLVGYLVLAYLSSFVVYTILS